MSSIYVCNLPYSVDQAQLKEIFEAYGEVTSSKVVTDRESGRSRGFGFVEMNESDAENAIQHLNGTEVSGREIKVSPAKPRQERPAGQGGYPKKNFGGNRNDNY